MTELSTEEILEVMQRTKREFYLSIFDIIHDVKNGVPYVPCTPELPPVFQENTNQRKENAS